MPSTYFDNFPIRAYTLNANAQPGEFELVTDILRRAAPVKELLKNRILFYAYTIKDGDTPEIIAHKYYGSAQLFWVVTLVNKMIDPLVDWPKNSYNFNAYIIDRYGSAGVAQSTIHHYTMTIAKEDSEGNVSEQTVIIDEDKYDSLSSVVPEVFTFADGSTVTKTTTRDIVYAYDYEQDVNEAKREIILLNKAYLSQFLEEFTGLIAI